MLHFELVPASPHETAQVTGQEAPLQSATSATETTIVRQQIESYAGMDQRNGLHVITQFVPAAYIVHDQVHVRVTSRVVA